MTQEGSIAKRIDLKPTHRSVLKIEKDERRLEIKVGPIRFLAIGYSEITSLLLVILVLSAVIGTIIFLNLI